jgi:hypothetical protein
MLNAGSVASVSDTIKTSFTPTLEDRPCLQNTIRIAKVAYIVLAVMSLYQTVPFVFDSTRPTADRVLAGILISYALFPICAPTMMKIVFPKVEVKNLGNNNTLFGIDDNTRIAIQNEVSFLKTEIIVVKDKT